MSGAMVGVAGRALIGPAKIEEAGVVRTVSETTRKVVLMLLAERAGADGRGAFPSLDTLAVEAGMSRRSVQRALQSLIDDGFVVRRLRRRRQSAVYDLRVDRLREVAVLRKSRVAQSVQEWPRGATQGS